MKTAWSRIVTALRRWNESPRIPRRERPPGKLIALRLARFLGIVLVLVLALVGVLSITRGTPIGALHVIGEREQLPAAGTEAHLRLLTLFAGVELSDGNGVQILANGDGTYPPLWADLRAARRSITIQMYFALPGAVADTLAAIAAERARAGVRVHVLLDAFGSQDLTGWWSDSLRSQGVHVAELRPMRWYTLDRAGRRSHVRAVVVDGAVGYTGGFGIADYWLGDGRTDGEWRETNVRFTGPEVARLQAAFLAAWSEATGDLITGDLYIAPADPAQASGGVPASLVYTTPSAGSTVAERLLALTIASARRTLYITNAYFLPDDDFRAFLRDAVRRGVDVRVLTASTKTDIKSVYFASRARYEELLRAGVRIYEYQPSMIHSKTVVVDGTWSLVGSMNFDNRSLVLNDESNLVSPSPVVGAALDSMFRDDLRHSREILLEDFQERPLWHRPLERIAVLLSRVL